MILESVIDSSVKVFRNLSRVLSLTEDTLDQNLKCL